MFTSYRYDSLKVQNLYKDFLELSATRQKDSKDVLLSKTISSVRKKTLSERIKLGRFFPPNC